MYPVSTEFLTAVRKNGRQTAARVTVNFDNLYIKRTLTATASNAYLAGQVTQIINTNANTAHWAALDGSWVLGHDYRIVPASGAASSNEFGVWSAGVSDSTGTLANPLSVTVTPAAGQSAFDVENLGVAFDVPDNEYATDFTIAVTCGSSAAQIFSVSGNANSKYYLGKNFQTVNQIVLKITKWSVSSRHAKVAEILFGESQVYTDSDLVKVDVVEELESAATDGTGIGAVSANQVTIDFNKQTVAFTDAQAQQGAQILPEIGVYLADGSIEYVPMGVYYAYSWDSSSSDLKTTVVAYDILYDLSETQHKVAPVVSDNLENLTLTLINEFWSLTSNQLDDCLADLSISNWWIANDDFRTAFQKIAYAANCYVFTGKSGALCILQKTDTTPVDTIEQDNIYSDSTNKSVAKSQLIMYYYVPVTQDASDVFSGTLTLTSDTTLAEEYSSSPAVNLSISPAADFSSADLQSWRAILVASTSGSVAVAISGQQIKTTENACSGTFSLNGKTGSVSFQNDLVQSDAQAQTLGVQLATRINEALNSYTVTCRGNPALELGDPVTAERRSGTVTARIQKAEYTYQGYLKTVYTLKGAS